MIELLKYILCAAGGAGIGYYVAQRRARIYYLALLDKETGDIRDFYKRKYSGKPDIKDENELESPAALAGAAMRLYEGDEDLGEEEPTPQDESDDQEAFRAIVEKGRLVERGETAKINYNAISTKPKDETPEVKEEEPDIRIDQITQQEFIANQFGYRQLSFTYFAGDDILANESDEPIDKDLRVGMIGADTIRRLRKYGADVGPVYVRNHTGKWEFEVSWSPGKHADEVGNIEDLEPSG